MLDKEPHLESHEALIGKVITRDFAVQAESIQRMTTGIANEVYTVALPNREVIARLSPEDRALKGSHEHIPLLKSKGIKVPDILSEDYSRQFIPYAYQVLSKIEGEDIGKVIHQLSDDELKAIAQEISHIFTKLREIPNNGKFGDRLGDDNDLVNSWTERMQGLVKDAKDRGSQTGVLDADLTALLDEIFASHKQYFDQVEPITYFDDMSSKNVMIHNGTFNGLVDLDALAQGDPLETIGRIKASWYGTHQGEVYTNAVMDAERLNPDQRKIVTVYALLNRISWACENGIQFNQNTSGTVDWEGAEKDKAIIREIATELKIHSDI